MRVWVFMLFLANLILAGFIYISEIEGSSPAAPSTDINLDKIRLVPFSINKAETKSAESAASCMQWSGIAGADLERARDLVTHLVSPNDVTETRVEGPTRFWVHIPPVANPSALLAKLRAADVGEVSVQPDNAISLGLFSAEETAQRHLNQIRGKGFTEARIESRSPHVKEATLIIAGLNKETAGKVSGLKDKFAGSILKRVDCPVPEKQSECVDCG